MNSLILLVAIVGQTVAQPRTNPWPWETAVRLSATSIVDEHTEYVGSGTVIYSDEEKAIALTCAHIFKGTGKRPTVFVDTFYPKLDGQRVHFKDRTGGWLMAYDPEHDLALVRFGISRTIRASRVAPENFVPKPKMRMFGVGSSEGRDATTWDTVVAVGPRKNVLRENPDYECIECTYQPAEGRSGGGLFTSDGYVVGVCNFADPQNNRGLYAGPGEIRKFLDRYGLSGLHTHPVYLGATQEAVQERTRELIETGWLGRLIFGPRRTGGSGNRNVNVSVGGRSCSAPPGPAEPPLSVDPQTPTSPDPTGPSSGVSVAVGPTAQPATPGRDGVDGKDGHNGIDGKQGAPGPPGAAGASVDTQALTQQIVAQVLAALPSPKPGPTGPAGPSGAVGPSGPAGSTGPVGPAGPAGTAAPAAKPLTIYLQFANGSTQTFPQQTDPSGNPFIAMKINPNTSTTTVPVTPLPASTTPATPTPGQ